MQAQDLLLAQIKLLALLYFLLKLIIKYFNNYFL